MTLAWGVLCQEQACHDLTFFSCLAIRDLMTSPLARELVCWWLWLAAILWLRFEDLGANFGPRAPFRERFFGDLTVRNPRGKTERRL